MLRSACLVSLLALGSPGPSLPASDFFEKNVRPVLVEHCLNCHGPKKQMASLRLDSREGLLKGGENGPAIVPGKPEASLLIQAVRHTGDLKMPPKKKLSPPQIDALAAWVKDGAPWPATVVGPSPAETARKHWAFQPIRRPAVPALAPGIVRNPVDAFLAARLSDRGLSLSPEADRRTLLRRLSFDLVGLPPTPEEIAAFENDASPDTYEKQVERLLASPAHGERWARHWLDVARYADTKGYVFFEEAVFPWAWTYRDYVIRSLNEDRPYDRFVLEQLAADRLDLGGDRRPLTALGFLTLGGRFMNNVHDILDDRIDVVTRGLLGLTVGCARCHDHKYDPISSRDYYSLYGVFASCREPGVPPTFLDPPRTPEYAKFVQELETREKKLSDFLAAKHQALVEGARKRAAEYLLAVHNTRSAPDTQEFMLIADGNDLNPAMINRWRAFLKRSQKTAEPVFALWHALSALPEKEFASRAADLLASSPRANPLILRVLRERKPVSMADVARVHSELLNAIEARPVSGLTREERELRQVFHGPGAPPALLPGEISELELLPDRASQGELQKFRNACQEWRVSGPGAPPRAMVLEDATKPVEPRVFLRGNPGNLGEAVPRRFLELLGGRDSQPFGQGSGRLELARAIIDPKNPLTARVIVNRVWLWHFGTGLVRTPSDFGLRSEPPSHPELLDWLADEFMRQGWSLKHLHRLIVTSQAYRQRSADRAEGRRLDPENVLLWRFPRRRLDYETMRDALLAVSGRLRQHVGGPSVQDSLSPAADRRTLYGHLDRLNVPGLLRTFDFPSPDATSPQRVETTIPQQALFLMNSPFAQDCARRLVQRPDVATHADVPGRVDRLYRLLFCRPATPKEKALAGDFLGPKPDPAAWERNAQAILLTNEFLFVD